MQFYNISVATDYFTKDHDRYEGAMLSRIFVIKNQHHDILGNPIDAVFPSKV